MLEGIDHVRGPTAIRGHEGLLGEGGDEVLHFLGEFTKLAKSDNTSQTYCESLAELGNLLKNLLGNLWLSWKIRCKISWEIPG